MGLAVKPSELIKFLESNGFEFDRQKGTSHAIYKNGVYTVPVPVHAKDVKTGTLYDILRRAGLTKQELEEWLGR